MPINGIEINIGKEKISQFPSIFAKTKISKLGCEIIICSRVPSEKSSDKKGDIDQIIKAVLDNIESTSIPKIKTTARPDS